MRRDPDTRYRYMRLVGSMGTIPLMLGVGPLLGYFAGHWLDTRFGTDPWLQILCIGLGLAAAVRYIVRLLKQVQKDMDRM